MTCSGVGVVRGCAFACGRRGTTIGVGLGFACAGRAVRRVVCADALANTQSATAPSSVTNRNLLTASGKRSTFKPPLKE